MFHEHFRKIFGKTSTFAKRLFSCCTNPGFLPFQVPQLNVIGNYIELLRNYPFEIAVSISVPYTKREVQSIQGRRQRLFIAHHHHSFTLHPPNTWITPEVDIYISVSLYYSIIIYLQTFPTQKSYFCMSIPLYTTKLQQLSHQMNSQVFYQHPKSPPSLSPPLTSH